MRIFFDMDGVLADFDRAVSGVPGYISVLNKASRNLPIAQRYIKKKNWLAIEKISSFWSGMLPVQNVNMLLDYAQSCGEMFVLTKVPSPDKFINGERYVNEIANAKRQWINNNMSQYFNPQNVIICDGDKGELIKPNRQDVLIDDRYENIVNWYDAGGMGILFKDSNRAMRELQLMRQR